MKVAILNAGAGWHTDDLCRALDERGHVGVVRPYEGLVSRFGSADSDRLSTGDVSLFDVDAVLARIIPGGSLEQIIYRVNVLHYLEKRHVPVMNTACAIERSVDKFYTTALLAETGLRVPDTIVCENATDALAAARSMGDVVIKPLFGSMGHGLVRVNDPDLAFRVVQTLAQLNTVFYIQRAVEHDGRDVRVFVVGGHVVGAIERLAPVGDWRTNVSRGGTAQAFDLPASWEEIALRAASVVGADYAGVDLMRDREGRVFVLEVNGIPGWRGLQQATGIDVAGAVVDHLAARVRTMKSERRVSP